MSRRKLLTMRATMRATMRERIGGRRANDTIWRWYEAHRAGGVRCSERTYRNGQGIQTMDEDSHSEDAAVQLDEEPQPLVRVRYGLAKELRLYPDTLDI